MPESVSPICLACSLYASFLKEFRYYSPNCSLGCAAVFGHVEILDPEYDDRERFEGDN